MLSPAHTGSPLKEAPLSGIRDCLLLDSSENSAVLIEFEKETEFCCKFPSSAYILMSEEIIKTKNKEDNPMKTLEELNALKEEVETVSKKLHELTEEELEQVNGGIKLDPDRLRKKVEEAYPAK